MCSLRLPSPERTEIKLAGGCKQLEQGDVVTAGRFRSTDEWILLKSSVLKGWRIIINILFESPMML